MSSDNSSRPTLVGSKSFRTWSRTWSTFSCTRVECRRRHIFCCRDLVRPDIEEHKDRTLTSVRETLRLEISPAYTQNLNDYQNLRAKWLAKYRNARRKPSEYKIPEPIPLEEDFGTRPGSPGVCDPTEPSGFLGSWTKEETPKKQKYKGKMSSQAQKAYGMGETIVVNESPRSHPPAPVVSPIDQALRYLVQAGYEGLTVDDLARLAPPDEQFDDELTVMADVRAYFTIACKVGHPLNGCI